MSESTIVSKGASNSKDEEDDTQESCKKVRKIEEENRQFNVEWEENYFFFQIKDKPVCLICGESLSNFKSGNVKRHFETRHIVFNTKYPLKTELRKEKVRDLKSKFIAQQNFFIAPQKKAANYNIASFAVTSVLMKRKCPISFPPISFPMGGKDMG